MLWTRVNMSIINKYRNYENVQWGRCFEFTSRTDDLCVHIRTRVWTIVCPEVLHVNRMSRCYYVDKIAESNWDWNFTRSRQSGSRSKESTYIIRADCFYSWTEHCLDNIPEKCYLGHVVGTFPNLITFQWWKSIFWRETLFIQMTVQLIRAVPPYYYGPLKSCHQAVVLPHSLYTQKGYTSVPRADR